MGFKISVEKNSLLAGRFYKKRFQSLEVCQIIINESQFNPPSCVRLEVTAYILHHLYYFRTEVSKERSFHVLHCVLGQISLSPFLFALKDVCAASRSHNPSQLFTVGKDSIRYRPFTYNGLMHLLKLVSGTNSLHMP